MRPEDRDMARLWDMLDAAQAIMEFVSGRRFEDMLQDRMLRAAIERNLEIIGEAARRVSQGFRDTHPEIPWQSIIGLRNVLAHEYGEIVYERLWVICHERLPVLVRHLKELGVEAPPDQSGSPEDQVGRQS